MRACLLPILLALTPVTAHADEVMVFAAASMKTALDEVAASFTAETGHEVILSYAGSNLLAGQIVAGAPADIFISAAIDWMDVVAAEGLVQEGQRLDLLGNSLVLIGAPEAAPQEITQALDLTGLLAGGKLAMGLVDAVPAGQYGKAALIHLGLWDSVAADVAQSDNVRAALALVAAGEAPLGITYATDAAADSAVRILGSFPPESHPPILYPAALLQNATDAGDAAFFAYLQSAPALDSFAAHGFIPLP